MFYQACLVVAQNRPPLPKLLSVVGVSDFPYREGHEDIFITESEGQSIKTAQIDNLIKWANLKPFSAAMKIGVVFEAQLLTTEAQNKLLKTLEEPPVDTLLVLIAPSPTALLSTIRSRCRLIQLEVPVLNAAETDASLKFAQQFLDADLEKRLALIKDELGESVERNKAIGFLADLCRAIIATPEKLAKLPTAQFYLAAVEKGANIKPALEALAMVL